MSEENIITKTTEELAQKVADSESFQKEWNRLEEISEFGGARVETRSIPTADGVKIIAYPVYDETKYLTFEDD